MRLKAFINETSVDLDFKLLISSDKGVACTVSAINKYCGYAMASSDVVKGSGYEYMFIKKLAIATYSAYV